MHYLALYLYWQSRRMMIGRFGYDDCPTLEEQLRCNLSLCASWTFLKSHSGKNLNTCSLTASTTSTHSTNKITVDVGKSRKGAIKLTVCFSSAVAVYRVPVFICLVMAFFSFSAVVNCYYLVEVTMFAGLGQRVFSWLQLVSLK